ncbi:30S ribosomal protein S27ae [Candidatus Woesearchaeota archaeon]|nr:30S ribosomal protein S27ae [Candidatus Woesearchaeota archaeon]
MAKKQRKPKRCMKAYKAYTISGNKIERKRKFCPKCGAGVFLAAHKNRLTCGKCAYVEFQQK